MVSNMKATGKSTVPNNNGYTTVVGYRKAIGKFTNAMVKQLYVVICKNTLHSCPNAFVTLCTVANILGIYQHHFFPTRILNFLSFHL